MKRALLIAALALTACHGKKTEPDDTPPMPSQELVAKRDLYAQLIETRRDADGFIETTECDSIHWSALAGAATHAINVRAALDADRRVYRRPLTYPECLASGASDSTVSQDALLMLLAYAVKYRDVDLVRDVFSFGHDHGWRMGDGDPFKVIMRPTLISLYARALKSLGGPDFPVERQVPPTVGPALRGFEAHLQVVALLTQLAVEGALPDSGVQILRDLVDREPNNALYRAALGKFDASQRGVAQALLLNATWWPADRLPTSQDRCEQWMTQRDELVDRELVPDADGCIEYHDAVLKDPVRECGIEAPTTRHVYNDDWLPCDQGRTHSGGDFLFAAAVLTGGF